MGNVQSSISREEAEIASEEKWARLKEERANRKARAAEKATAAPTEPRRKSSDAQNLLNNWEPRKEPRENSGPPSDAPRGPKSQRNGAGTQSRQSTRNGHAAQTADNGASGSAQTEPVARPRGRNCDCSRVSQRDEYDTFVAARARGKENRDRKANALRTVENNWGPMPTAIPEIQAVMSSINGAKEVQSLSHNFPNWGKASDRLNRALLWRLETPARGRSRTPALQCSDFICAMQGKWLHSGVELDKVATRHSMVIQETSGLYMYQPGLITSPSRAVSLSPESSDPPASPTPDPSQSHGSGDSRGPSRSASSSPLRPMGSAGSTSQARPLVRPHLADPDHLPDQNDAKHGLAKNSQGKRPAEDSLIIEQSLASLPKIPKRLSTTVTTPLPPPPTIALASSGSGSVRQVPAWYQDTKVSTRVGSGSSNSNAGTAITRLKDSVTRCKRHIANRQTLEHEFSIARQVVHKLAFEVVDKALLRTRRILHNEDGLPQIFDPAFANNVPWLWDIKADAEELYNKWCAHIFEPDLLRGIVVPTRASRENSRNDYKIAKDNTPLMEADSFGAGKLLNGQWWPRQICLVRDGAHGASQAGIYGTPGVGAFSVIVAGGGGYQDIDEGETLLYCGTDSTDGTRTRATQCMLDSVGSPHPVRVIRSSNAKPHYAPEIGFRYDGLYLVVSSENLDEASSKRQRHRFKLVRQQDQDPIRGGEGPEARPTPEETKAYTDDKRMRGF